MSDIGKGIGTAGVWATVAVLGVYGNVIPEIVVTVALMALLATAIIWH